MILFQPLSKAGRVLIPITRFVKSTTKITTFASPRRPSICYNCSSDYITLSEQQEHRQDFQSYLHHANNDIHLNPNGDYPNQFAARIAQNAQSLKAILFDGPRPTPLVIACFIRAIKEPNSDDDLKLGIHATIIKTSLDSEVPVATALVGFYSSRDNLEVARRVFRSSATRDLILCSAIISACCKNRHYFEAIDTFREMQCSGVAPNIVTLLSVLLACANTEALPLGEEAHAFAIRRRLDFETSLCNSLVDMYSKCGEQVMCSRVFDRIAEKDIISWKSSIFACIRDRSPREAALLFSAMRREVVEPDEVITQNIVGASSMLKDPVLGTSLHSLVTRDGLSGFASVATSLLLLYAELGDEESSGELFAELRHKDTAAWSAIVSVYSRAGLPCLALDVLREMQSENVRANEVTLVCSLQACPSSGADRRQGKSVHAKLVRLGREPNPFALLALIDFYCRGGGLAQAELLFERHESRDLVCWSSMIKGYGMNGFGEAAVGAFHGMLDRGMRPNEVVLMSVLSACSHCGMVDEGLKVFDTMEEGEFGVRPSEAHRACVVDMLGRQGRMQEALRFVEKMAVVPDEIVWGALLSWCGRTRDDLRVAEIAVERLVERDPDNPSYYVTLSNMYSEIGDWERAERIRRLIDENWLSKAAGSSSVGF